MKNVTFNRIDYVGGSVLAYAIFFGIIAVIQPSRVGAVIIGVSLVASTFFAAHLRERDIVEGMRDRGEKAAYWRVRMLLGLLLAHFIGAAFIIRFAEARHYAAYAETLDALATLIAFIPAWDLLIHRGKAYYDSKARREQAQLLKAEANAA